MTEDGVPMISDISDTCVRKLTLPSSQFSRGYTSDSVAVNWLAPEIVSSYYAEDSADTGGEEFSCTKEADMWAYGMVVYVSNCIFLCHDDLLRAYRN